MTKVQKLPKFDITNKRESVKKMFAFLKSKGVFKGFKTYKQWDNRKK